MLIPPIWRISFFKVFCKQQHHKHDNKCCCSSWNYDWRKAISLNGCKLVKLDVVQSTALGPPLRVLSLSNATDLLTPVVWTIPVGVSKVRSYILPFVDKSSPDYVRGRGRDHSLQRRFPTVDILFRSVDIRSRITKSSEIAPKKHFDREYLRNGTRYRQPENGLQSCKLRSLPRLLT